MIFPEFPWGSRKLATSRRQTEWSWGGIDKRIPRTQSKRHQTHFPSWHSTIQQTCLAVSRIFITIPIRRGYTARTLTSCSKSPAGLLPYSQQGDISMRSHRLHVIDAFFSIRIFAFQLWWKKRQPTRAVDTSGAVPREHDLRVDLAHVGRVKDCRVRQCCWRRRRTSRSNVS